VAVLASLLTLVAMSRIWTLAFWRPRSQAPAPEPPPEEEAGEEPGLSRQQRYSRRLVRGVTTGMVALGLAVAVLAGPLTSWSLQAATDLLDRTAYQRAVLGGEAP